MTSPKKASSQVSWALLTEGVTQARVDLHRLRLMLHRAEELVSTSTARDHIWQVAGDLLTGFPDRLSEVERAVDRTAYALVVMGQEFLRGRLSIDDRYVVDESMKVEPYSKEKPVKESIEARVASRYLEAQVAPSAESNFFDNPKKRETREFAETGALSNVPATAGKAVKEMETDLSVAQAKSDARKAPPTPTQIRKEPGGKQFSTLNRYIVQTDQPKVKGVPTGWDDVGKSPKPGKSK